jgi:hypothetical protein
LKTISVTIPLSRAFLCPGEDGEAHITDNPAMCGCGNTNLFPLARILDRQDLTPRLVQMTEEYPFIGRRASDRINSIRGGN